VNVPVASPASCASSARPSAPSSAAASLTGGGARQAPPVQPGPHRLAPDRTWIPGQPLPTSYSEYIGVPQEERSPWPLPAPLRTSALVGSTTPKSSTGARQTSSAAGSVTLEWPREIQNPARSGGSAPSRDASVSFQCNVGGAGPSYQHRRPLIMRSAMTSPELSCRTLSCNSIGHEQATFTLSGATEVYKRATMPGKDKPSAVADGNCGMETPIRPAAIRPTSPARAISPVSPRRANSPVRTFSPERAVSPLVTHRISPPQRQLSPQGRAVSPPHSPLLLSRLLSPQGRVLSPQVSYTGPVISSSNMRIQSPAATWATGGMPYKMPQAEPQAPFPFGAKMSLAFKAHTTRWNLDGVPRGGLRR
jgi:hypothetical protein